jgi:hypothetical protein
MDKDKNLLENEQLFKTLFEYSDEKDEKLYKNDLFTPSVEEDGLSPDNSQKNQTEIIRDKILKKLSIEDYMLFPPKNDSILITDNELGKDKEEPEKLFEDEIDHLRNLHRLNYLTFSPFGISFFPNLNNISEKKEEQTKNVYAFNELEEANEREEKILNIIDFDYNNYEINNDLLFNISMGFIDIDKLKHENVVSSENFIPRSERFSNGRQLKTVNNINIKPETKPKKSIIKKKSVESIYNKDVEFKEDLMNKLLKFVKEHENIEFYSSTINNFSKELNAITKLEKNNEKNKLLIKWERIFIERHKLYQRYLVDQQQKERKKRKNERIIKDYQKKIEEQKMFEIQKERKFEEELEKIRQKGLKNFDKNRKSVISGIGDIKREFFNDKFGLRSSDIAPTTLYSLRSNSSCSLNNKIDKKYSNKNIFKSTPNLERKSVNYNDERYGYQKSNNDYYFKQI